MGWVGGGMDYRASGYGVHVVQRRAGSIPPERFNVDTLMKLTATGPAWVLTRVRVKP